MRVLVALFFLSTKASYALVVEKSDKLVVRPLGHFTSKRPPIGARVVDLGEIRVDFSATQVCGYTDWSTAAISLPKQLLSASYWKKVGANLRQEAINSILAISGALPSMLACNASPTFCAILNRAQALAQGNLRFTFDSCQILEGLSDVSKSHFEAQRSCVSKYTHKGYSAATALDKCSLGSDLPDKSSARDKLNNAIAEAKESYKKEKLDNKLCREKSSPSYSRSIHAYSVSTLSCRWLKEFFPGISVEASGKFSHGGTFSKSPSEELYSKYVVKTTNYLLDLLDTMHALRFGLGKYAAKGALPRTKVLEHKDLKRKLGIGADAKIIGFCYPSDGPSCKARLDKIPPIYRLSSFGGIPEMMISPETLYELVVLVPKAKLPSHEYGDGKITQVAMALEPLVQSIGYIKAQNVISDAILELKRTCLDPELQSVAAKEDCKARLELIEQDQKNLRVRNELDQRHLSAQARFYAELRKLKAQRVSVNALPAARGASPLISPSAVE